MKSLLLFALAFCLEIYFGQNDSSNVFAPATFYDRNVKDCFSNPAYRNTFKSYPSKYNDISLTNRVWRTIKLDNPENKNVYKDLSNCLQIGLIEIVKFGIFEKQLNVFGNSDFNSVQDSRMDRAQVLNGLKIQDTIFQLVYDASGNETNSATVENRFVFEKDVVAYLLKEDWAISAISGKLEKRIVGFAPMIRNKFGFVIPLFWLYWQEWKELLSSFPVISKYKNEKSNYTEIFEKGYFISQVSKESNVFDRSIKSSKHAKDPLIESELIKEKILNTEMDLFQH